MTSGIAPRRATDMIAGRALDARIRIDQMRAELDQESELTQAFEEATTLLYSAYWIAHEQEKKNR